MEKLAITVAEAAKVLGVSRNFVYDLARTPGFPAFKVGGKVLISYSLLAEWVEAQAGGSLQIDETEIPN